MSEPQLSESLVDALTELGQGVAVVDLETQRYLFVNDALAEMYGYARDELLAMDSFFALLPQDEVETLEPERAARAAGEERATDRYETRVVRKDGEVIEIEVSVK